MVFLDLFCDGGVDIDIIGSCARATWFVMHHGDRVPIASLIVPTERLKGIARQFAAAELMRPDDIGRVAGSG